jgi:hypothetical protein
LRPKTTPEGSLLKPVIPPPEIPPTIGNVLDFNLHLFLFIIGLREVKGNFIDFVSVDEKACMKYQLFIASVAVEGEVSSRTNTIGL